jgi:hypothetical protein
MLSLTGWLIVETTVAPLGTVKAERDWQNSKGLATCSITCKAYKVQSISKIQGTINKVANAIGQEGNYWNYLLKDEFVQLLIF